MSDFCWGIQNPDLARWKDHIEIQDIVCYLLSKETKEPVEDDFDKEMNLLETRARASLTIHPKALSKRENTLRKTFDIPDFAIRTFLYISMSEDEEKAISYKEEEKRTFLTNKKRKNDRIKLFKRLNTKKRRR